jgi:hypothetical protein
MERAEIDRIYSVRIEIYNTLVKLGADEEEVKKWRMAAKMFWTLQAVEFFSKAHNFSVSEEIVAHEKRLQAEVSQIDADILRRWSNTPLFVVLSCLIPRLGSKAVIKKLPLVLFKQLAIYFL